MNDRRLLVIMGGGPSVWEDRSTVSDPCDEMAINDVSMFCSSKHAYSNHGSRHKIWRQVRAFENRGYRPAERYHTTSHINMNLDLPDWIEKHPVPPQGGSGLVAVQVGLLLGYERVILCGVPCTFSGHFYGPRLFMEGKVGNLGPTLERLRDSVFQGRVRSVSGLSKQILGSPSDPW